MADLALMQPPVASGVVPPIASMPGILGHAADAVRIVAQSGSKRR